ncbi:hypothetical protein ID866_5783 [Astraeus odoratus]|nr:hypothetical protein ID866_5783 [Astraeus odoratus]
MSCRTPFRMKMLFGASDAVACNPVYVDVWRCHSTYYPGIAYTIDPLYESEVRDHLGELGRCSLSARIPAALKQPRFECMTEVGWTRSTSSRLPGKGIWNIFLGYTSCWLLRQSLTQDGYTLETLDVYTIEDSIEKVIVHNVSCPHTAMLAARITPHSVRVISIMVLVPLSHTRMAHILVGSEPLEALAQRIWRSVGPSGRNKVGIVIRVLSERHHYGHPQDYLYGLAESVRVLAPASYDSHLFALEARIRELDNIHGEVIQGTMETNGLCS